MTQAIGTIFSYSLVFLLGVILGAVGELVWNGRFGKPSTPVEPSLQQRIEIPQINVDLPGESQPAANVEINATNIPIQVVNPIPMPVPAAAQPQPAAKPAKEDLKKPMSVLSIVEQVDEILQELQKFSKSTLPMVSLLDDGKQGVVVKVGNQTYPGIDAVTDPEAQGMIRQAVTEWERRSARK